MKQDLRKYTLQEALNVLAKSDNDEWFMRAAVAKYSKTSPKTLAKLTRDEFEEVRVAATGNPRNFKKTLDELADNEEILIRIEVAWNPSTSPKTLKKMARRDCTEEEMRGIIHNPSTEMETLEYIATQGWRTYEIKDEVEEQIERRKKK